MRLEAVRTALREPLPAVTLLLGPWSNDLAHDLVNEAAMERHSASFWWEVTAESARRLQAYCASPRLDSRSEELLVLLMDEASEQAQNALLKLLEEPPPWARFILLAQQAPLPTILSRAHVLRWSAGDQSADAQSRERVREVLAAAYRRDGSALARLFRDWGTDEHAALLTWAVARVSEHPWREPNEQEPFTRGAALFLLQQMSSSARPRVGDRSAVEQMVTRYG